MARLIVLSCGVPTPHPGRWGTAFALQVGRETLLVDCGPAATLKLYQAGLRATDVSRVFFTHLHSDHMADFPCFLMTRFDMSVGGETPLHVYGPPPTAAFARKLMGPDKGVLWLDVVARTNHPMSIGAYHSRGGAGDRPPPHMQAHDIEPGPVASGTGWTVSAAEVRHAQPYLTCLGFRFETDDGVIVFSGDTRPCDEVIELARGADLLVMEAVALADRQWEGSRTAESDTTGCATVAAAAGVKRLAGEPSAALAGRAAGAIPGDQRDLPDLRRTGAVGRRAVGGRDRPGRVTAKSRRDLTGQPLDRRLDLDSGTCGDRPGARGFRAK